MIWMTKKTLFDYRQSKDNFFFSKTSRRALWFMHPPSCSMDTRDPFAGVKRPGREADHTLPSSSGNKDDWRHTPTFIHVP
jgi:hypothetical protein